MKESRLLPVFVIVIALGTLLYLLKPILMPFLISFLKGTKRRIPSPS